MVCNFIGVLDILWLSDPSRRFSLFVHPLSEFYNLISGTFQLLSATYFLVFSYTLSNFFTISPLYQGMSLTGNLLYLSTMLHQKMRSQPRSRVLRPQGQPQDQSSAQNIAIIFHSSTHPKIQEGNFQLATLNTK